MNRQYVAEAIGTFSLIFAGTGAIVVNDVSGALLAVAGCRCTQDEDCYSNTSMQCDLNLDVA
jgi:glycerol uptake facilitator-like aquaporin